MSNPSPKIPVFHVLVEALPSLHLLRPQTVESFLTFSLTNGAQPFRKEDWLYLRHLSRCWISPLSCCLQSPPQFRPHRFHLAHRHGPWPVSLLSPQLPSRLVCRSDHVTPVLPAWGWPSPAFLGKGQHPHGIHQGPLPSTFHSLSSSCPFSPRIPSAPARAASPLVLRGCSQASAPGPPHTRALPPDSWFSVAPPTSCVFPRGQLIKLYDSSPLALLPFLALFSFAKFI